MRGLYACKMRLCVISRLVIDDSGNQDLELVGPQVLFAKTKLQWTSILILVVVEVHIARYIFF
jgi:hypothetical protein